MKPHEAIDAIYAGREIVCTREEYPAIRSAVLTKIAKWTEWALPNFAAIGRSEIERLDGLLPPRTESRVVRGTLTAIREALLNGSRFLLLTLRGKR